MLDEIIVLMDQGLYQDIHIWRPGFLHLTDRELMFKQGNKSIFRRNIRALYNVKIVRRKCIIGKNVDQLMMTFKDRVEYVAIRKTVEWVDIIEEIMAKNLG